MKDNNINDTDYLSSILGMVDSIQEAADSVEEWDDDEICLQICERALKAHKQNPITYTHEEVRKMLNL